MDFEVWITEDGWLPQVWTASHFLCSHPSLRTRDRCVQQCSFNSDIKDMFICTSLCSKCLSKCWLHTASFLDCLHPVFRHSSWGWSPSAAVSVTEHLFGELNCCNVCVCRCRSSSSCCLPTRAWWWSSWWARVRAGSRRRLRARPTRQRSRTRRPGAFALSSWLWLLRSKMSCCLRGRRLA